MFQLPGAAWRLRFETEVLRKLERHAQRGLLSRESVGQLYALDLTGKTVVVAKATRLKPSWASWSRVRFDVQQAMREREQLFRDGWHCVGFWHTHPEPDPTPSPEDRALAAEHARAALTLTNGMVFAIVGTRTLPGGLRVWCHTGSDLMNMPVETPGIACVSATQRS
jgi:proteasome lid subunit RPN8/RPN11